MCKGIERVSSFDARPIDLSEFKMNKYPKPGLGCEIFLAHVQGHDIWKYKKTDFLIVSPIISSGQNQRLLFGEKDCLRSFHSDLYTGCAMALKEYLFFDPSVSPNSR